MSPAIFLALLLAAVQPPDVVVVCPKEFRAALEPWVEYRQEQGHRLAFVSNLGTAAEIRQEIIQVGKGGGLRFVVLVGDADPRLEQDRALRARSTPLHYAKAKVNVLWGSEPYISTDNPYADLNGDGKPDVAVGRITADSPAELAQITAKIMAYERGADYTCWRRQLNVVAGVGGFGALADGMIESTARYFLTQNVPPAYNLSMTYGSWQSPLCPDPRRFHETTLDRLNEGSLFWVYIGHGQPLGLDRARMPDGQYPIFTGADAGKLKCRHSAPIALFLACYVGALDCVPDCLGEEMLRQPGGPVAVLAGSRVTMPYAMSLLACGLMDQLFQQQPDTLGEAVLRAKQGLLKPPAEGDRQRAMLDALARAVSPAPEQLADERTEHVLMFNMLGDPMTRLRYPKPVKFDVAAKAMAGQRLRVTGESPVDGLATMELVVERGRTTSRPPARREYPRTAEGLAEFQAVYQKANDPRWATKETQVVGGRFEVEFEVPAEAWGDCHVRGYVEGKQDFALGSADLIIQQSAVSSQPTAVSQQRSAISGQRSARRE